MAEIQCMTFETTSQNALELPPCSLSFELLTVGNLLPCCVDTSNNLMEKITWKQTETSCQQQAKI